jgi:hypothetical protein
MVADFLIFFLCVFLCVLCDSVVSSFNLVEKPLLLRREGVVPRWYRPAFAVLGKIGRFSRQPMSRK